MQKAACLCLALVAASLLAVPVVALVAWANLATGVPPDWVAVVVFHVALACGAVALYRRWLPRMAGRRGKAACLCLALVAASLLAVPVVALVAWANLATGVPPDWMAVVVFHVALACGAVALYRRWLPRMAGRGNAEAG